MFSPRLDDERARALDDRLSARTCELAERDLLVGRLPAAGEARLGENVLAPESATRLRREYRIGGGDFTVVLVGKDGGEKLRTAQVPELDSVFALIDGMPMRMAEMRSRGQTCSTGTRPATQGD